MKYAEDQRISALEQRMAAAAAPPAPAEANPESSPPAAKGKTPAPKAPAKKTAEAAPAEGGPAPAAAEAMPASDPGEDAYSQGFHQWEAGQYDQAISTLKAFTQTYPTHRRISYANNLIGRALL